MTDGRPGDADLMAALEAFGAGDLGLAGTHLERARELDPDHPEIWFGLGAVAWRSGRHEDGINAMDRAVSLAPQVWKYWDLLIRSLIQLRLHELAERTCAGATAAGHDIAPLYHYWAYTLQELKDYAAAVKKFEHAAELAPDDRMIRRNMSVPLLHLNRLEDAVAAFSQSTLDIAEADAAGAKVDAGHFDRLAEGYDANSLHTQMVEHMVRFIDVVVPGGLAAAARIVDCGCGTGLFAKFLDAKRQHLAGIDISPAMIERARATGAYAELVEADMAAGLAGLAGDYDLIVSSDAMFYVADLGPVFAAASQRLKPGGHLFFGTEPVTDEFDVRATAPGEYAHSRAYLKRTAAAAGLETVEIRIMMHRARPGFWCVFRKPA